jgi:hypothetical protein
MKLVVSVASLLVLGCPMDGLTAAESELPHSTSWVGSTWSENMGGGGGARAYKKWLDMLPFDLCVTAEGTVYANAWYDENGAEATVVNKDGQWLGRLSTWGLRGQAITVDEQTGYVYCHDSWSENHGLKDVESTRIVRIPPGHYNTSDSSCSSFAVHPGVKGKMDFPITGLAVNKGELFVADGSDNTIKVYGLSEWPKPALHRKWAFDKPWKIAVDKPTGNLWVVQNDALKNCAQKDAYPYIAKVVLCDKTTGEALKSITDMKSPTDLAYNSTDHTLWVCEGGRDYQIRIYKDLATQPKLDRTFGAKGGIFSGKKGEWQPLKFLMPTGLGLDASGNVYVGMGQGQYGWGPTLLESYTKDGQLRWKTETLDCTCTFAMDPVTEDAYGVVSHLAMDWDKTTPGTEYSLKGYTLDYFANPNDARLGGNIGTVFGVRNIQGKRFLYVGGCFATTLAVFRFGAAADGEILTPCAVFDSFGTYAWKSNWTPPGHPGKSWAGDWYSYLWCDTNANGVTEPNEFQRLSTGVGATSFCVDDRGDMWWLGGKGVVRYRVALKNGIPIYDPGSTDNYELPGKPFTEVLRVLYDTGADVCYFTGATSANPLPPDPGQVVGTTLIRYNRFTSGNPAEAWRIVLPGKVQPYDNRRYTPRCMDIAGDYVFAEYGQGAELTEVYRKSDGGYVGQMGVGKLYTQCLNDQPMGMRAFKRKNGEYVVFKQRSLGPCIMLRWRPGK